MLLLPLPELWQATPHRELLDVARVNARDHRVEAKLGEIGTKAAHGPVVDGLVLLGGAAHEWLAYHAADDAHQVPEAEMTLEGTDVALVIREAHKRGTHDHVLLQIEALDQLERRHRILCDAYAARTSLTIENG